MKCSARGGRMVSEYMCVCVCDCVYVCLFVNVNVIVCVCRNNTVH